MPPSNKYLLLILKRLDNLFLAGNDVLINGYCEEDDEDLLETVEECKSMLSLPIDLHEIEIDDDEEF